MDLVPSMQRKFTNIFSNPSLPSLLLSGSSIDGGCGVGIVRTLLGIASIIGNDDDGGRDGVTLATVGATGLFLKAPGSHTFLPRRFMLLAGGSCVLPHKCGA